MKTACVGKPLIERYKKAGGFLWQDRTGKWHVGWKKPPKTARKVAHYKEMRQQFGSEERKKWNVVRVKVCP